MFLGQQSGIARRSDMRSAYVKFCNWWTYLVANYLPIWLAWTLSSYQPGEFISPQRDEERISISEDNNTRRPGFSFHRTLWGIVQLLSQQGKACYHWIRMASLVMLSDDIQDPQWCSAMEYRILHDAQRWSTGNAPTWGDGRDLQANSRVG